MQKLVHSVACRGVMHNSVYCALKIVVQDRLLQQFCMIRMLAPQSIRQTCSVTQYDIHTLQ